METNVKSSFEQNLIKITTLNCNLKLLEQVFNYKQYKKEMVKCSNEFKNQIQQLSNENQRLKEIQNDTQTQKNSQTEELFKDNKYLYKKLQSKQTEFDDLKQQYQELIDQEKQKQAEFIVKQNNELSMEQFYLKEIQNLKLMHDQEIYILKKQIHK